jgi:hypothetical protein
MQILRRAESKLSFGVMPKLNGDPPTIGEFSVLPPKPPPEACAILLTPEMSSLTTESHLKIIWSKMAHPQKTAE